MEQDIINDYEQRVTLAQHEVDKYEKLINKYSLMRLVVFALVVFSIYLSVKTIGFGLLAILFIILMLCFAWLVSRQSFFIERKKYFTALKTVTQNEIDSIAARSNIYDNGSEFVNDKHYYTSDLDIFGEASLYQLVNRTVTVRGKKLLANWLSKPSPKAIILNRQDAIHDIALKNTWKLDFQAKLLFAKGVKTEQLNKLFEYLKAPISIPSEDLLRAYIKIAPYLLIGAMLGGYYYPVVNLLAISIAIFNSAILIFKSSFIVKSSFVADKIGEVLNDYVKVFQTIENGEWEVSDCDTLVKSLQQKQTAKQIAELSKLINKLSYSLIMVVGFVLNVFLLWSLKQILAIEDWKRNNHQNLEDAFDTIAEFEALVSLASLRINYPEWCLPTIADGEGYTVTAKQIAHPLIDTKNRVANDYQLEDAFKIDIITGSNMAGKSTFLRTIGINIVLALCGAPVCADAMEVSVVTVLSYMRIKDSLNESTSTFKAELDRLQMLLAAVDSDQKIFFLIDEMLRGTNSVDKYLGSKAVIEQLISKKGVGIVATHDLQIAELEKQYSEYVRNFYFDIQVKEGEMLFDYKIKNGECKTFNASLLLKQIGINVE